jgi:hypothetical protein
MSRPLWQGRASIEEEPQRQADALHVAPMTTTQSRKTCPSEQGGTLYMHMAAFGPVLALPAGQGEHPRSAVSLGGVETYWPSTQSIQGVHEAALATALKPLSQCEQTSSVVEVPIMDTNEPGEHAPCCVHMVAFRVLLKVPAGQASQAGRVLVPPVTT